MNRTILGAVAALLLALPAQAGAQECDWLWSTDRPAGTAADLGVAALRRDGSLLYATGGATFTPARRLPSGAFAPPSWATSTGAPATQAYSSFPNRPGPGGSVLVLPPQSVGILVLPVHTSPIGRSRGATVTVRFEPAPRAAPRLSFVATCSANRTLRGSAGNFDFLISLRPPG